ncbi:hypothetical protein [Sphingomonas montanisoli]|nr:hypothetical protein [Sphingomonas montanisoli]
MRATLLVLMLALAAPAEAGLRATYFDAGKTRALVIEVADNGDARIGEADSSDYGLMIGDRFYVIGDKEGMPMVADIADVGAAIDRIMPPIFGDLLRAPDAAAVATGLKLTPDGGRSVGGHTGTIYHVKGLDTSDPAKTIDYVISREASLVPVGRALERFMNSALVPAAPLVGPAIKTIIAETRAIFALGTPIDVGGRFLLDRVETVDVPANRLKLPATPQTVDQLAAAMKTEQAEDAHR